MINGIGPCMSAWNLPAASIHCLMMLGLLLWYPYQVTGLIGLDAAIFENYPLAFFGRFRVRIWTVVLLFDVLSLLLSIKLFSQQAREWKLIFVRWNRNPRVSCSAEARSPFFFVGLSCCHTCSLQKQETLFFVSCCHNCSLQKQGILFFVSCCHNCSLQKQKALFFVSCCHNCSLQKQGTLFFVSCCHNCSLLASEWCW